MVTVLAAGAHPDDIEFMMAGTVLLLKERGAVLHMWNIANGCCGTLTHGRDEIIHLRSEEAKASALEAGAVWHAPVADDMAIFFSAELLAKVAAVVRDIKPDIMLVPSLFDYMEDHLNTARLLTMAAFARGMPNFKTEPPVPRWDGETVIYHAMPYGLRDWTRRVVMPGQYVDVSRVMDRKRLMLAMHRTQGEWLDASQGVGSYIGAMDEMCRELGEMSGRFTYAEGWMRHNHIGYSRSDEDPLSDILG
ncbi:MAG: LmbE family protein [Candidatus Anoxymicrobium japonicum]|uniref:LmbE family protein n=1 Tax=Candidatus Anoxymicrobium japonicum TaxID=2013648 RepID=A0A2N3G550_9ACTN|nr:MAG: LmbE family protein [Candidatus Anoxymicrobium japonicum]